MVCTFFGHRDCYSLDAAVLRSAIEDLIKQGVTEFLVGHQGQFDAMVPTNSTGKRSPVD